MGIRPDGEGKLRLEAPAQQWHGGHGGDTTKLQVASFAGHPLMVVVNDDKGGFDLHYLGFMEWPYPTMEHAKSQATGFAKAVLDEMKSKIAGARIP